MKEILGFYKDYNLVKEDDRFFVVNRPKRDILLITKNETEAEKYFIMLAAKFINEKWQVV